MPEHTHTFDVQTARGWVRLELTDAQADELATELATLHDLPEGGPQIRPDQSARPWTKN